MILKMIDGECRSDWLLEANCLGDVGEDSVKPALQNFVARIWKRRTASFFASELGHGTFFFSLSGRGLHRMTVQRNTSVSRHFVEVSRSVALVLWLLCCASPPATTLADTMTTREILNLEKFGKNISSVSWCSDETLTFVDTQPRQAETQEAESRSTRTVNMLSLTTGKIRPLLAYPDANLLAHCVRQGEYVYVSGSIGLGYRRGVSANAGARLSSPFNQLVEILREENPAKRPMALNVRRNGDAFRGAVLTDADGNVYGRVDGGFEPERKNIKLEELTTSQRDRLTYMVKKDYFEFIVFSSDQYSTGPQAPKFGIYGVSTPKIYSRNLGSYKCPAPRPGCTTDGTGKNVVYYTLLSYATSAVPRQDARFDTRPALYTVVPGLQPTIQRWPIVAAKAPRLSYEPEIIDIALDQQRCLVLLQPDRELASSRVAGRLRMDLLIADCEFKDGKLAYSEPRHLSSKQGSFIFPTLTLRGEYAVVTDFYDESSQEEDQVKFERAENERAKICVRLFLGARAASLQRTNSLCALVSRLGGGGWDGERLTVSPSGRFIAFAGGDKPLIVGRDYKKDEHGPDWLTNGE